MKKIATLVLAVVMILSVFAISASAESFVGNGKCTASFEIKKADPANVKKDGIIGEGEYEKIDVSKDDLAINFISANCYLTADAMASTMEYYFSWDEVNGLNFAVKYDAYPLAAAESLGYAADQILDGFKTSVEQPGLNENGIPKDNFLFNVGVNFASGWNDETNNHLFYYGVGKKIDGSSYLTGHWGQLGKDGQYEAVGGQDFEFSYNGTVVTAEWSIPFAEFGYDGATAGSDIEFTVVACAGGAEVDDALESDDNKFFEACNSWSVALGQKGFLVQVTRDAQRAKATLVDEVIPGPVADTTTVDTTAADTTSVDTTNNDGTTAVGQTTTQPITPATTRVETSVVESEVVVTDDEGNAVTDEAGEVVTEIVTEVITSIVTDAPTESAGQGTSSPVTGDPMIIAAVVAAISACGVVVAKKRK